MTVAEVKNDLILQILKTNYPLLLEHLAQYFQSLFAHEEPELLEELEDVILYDQVKNRNEERISLDDYLAQRKARTNA